MDILMKSLKFGFTIYETPANSRAAYEDGSTFWSELQPRIRELFYRALKPSR